MAPRFHDYKHLEDTLLVSAARISSDSFSSSEDWGSYRTLRLALDVSAATGTTPTLDVVVEDSIDGGTNWNTLATFAQNTATGREVLNITSPFGRKLRVRWTIAGTTPSFTFKVDVWASST